MGLNEVLMKVFEERTTRTEVFTESFKLMYPIVKEEVTKMKRELNERYLALVKDLKNLDWRSLLQLSALANSIDYEMKWVTVNSEPMNSDERSFGFLDPEALSLLDNAKSVALLLDNAGEAVVDIVLALKLVTVGKDVVLIAREEPYEVDVTVEEVRKLMSEIAENLGETPLINFVKVISTGSNYPAFAVRNRDVSELLLKVDAIISKGIANLEAALDFGFPEKHKVVVALRAKCPPIAELMKVPLGAPVIKLMSRVQEVVEGLR
ncbi:MAG: ARMT1-like domain-containing protein [Acidilobaceae archaeon]